MDPAILVDDDFLQLALTARLAQTLRPRLAVLYCTGHPEKISEEMGPALGPVLSKPFPVEQLHREITRVHQQQAFSRENLL